MTEMRIRAVADSGPVTVLTASHAEDAGLPAIELSAVTKDFHSGSEVVTAVRDMDLQIKEGEFFSMLPPTGCGQTTTMPVIAGFEDTTASTGWLHDKEVTLDPA